MSYINFAIEDQEFLVIKEEIVDEKIESKYVYESTTSVLDELESVLNSLDPPNLPFGEIPAPKVSDYEIKTEEIPKKPEVISCIDCEFRTNTKHILTLHRNYQHGQNNETNETSQVEASKTAIKPFKITSTVHKELKIKRKRC